MKILFKILMVLAGLVILISLFYAEEDWRGKRAWENFKREWEAKGERFDWQSVVPPPMPDEQNFAMAPIFAATDKLLVAKLPHPQPEPSPADRLDMNVCGRLDGYFEEQPKVTADWAKGTFTDLKPWQAYYRAPARTNDYLASTTNVYLVSPHPQSPAADVLLALSKYDSEIVELRQASQRPYSRFPVAYEQDNKSEILLVHLTPLKRCTEVLQLRARAELQNGQSERALADMKLSLYLVNSIRTEPFLMSHLVRATMFQITLQQIYEGLAEHKWSDEQLAELDRELAKFDFLADYKSSLRGDLNFQVVSIDGMRRLRDYRHSIFGFRSGSFLSSVGDNSKPWEDYTFNWDDYWRASLYHLAPSGWFYQNQMNCARMVMEYSLPVVDANGHAVSLELSRRADVALKGDREHWTFRNILESMLLPATSAIERRFTYAQATTDLARTAIALERCRLAHGEYPETLAALAPQFIAQLPHDVIGGQPLKYHRTDDGRFVLYSIGWNEKDDGGAVIFRKKPSTAVDTEKGDWVWQYPMK